MRTIVLIGMMGCGKTSVGERLANIVNSICVDIDLEIVKNTNMTINDIFAKKGEAYFRELEKNTIKNVFTAENTIISLGGGAFENEQTREFLLSNSVVIYLETSAQEIFNRLKNDTTRPLLKNNMSLDNIQNIINKREINYKKANVIIKTDNKSPQEIAQEILSEVKWKK